MSFVKINISQFANSGNSSEKASYNCHQSKSLSVSPMTLVTVQVTLIPDTEKLIIDLRKNYKFGPKRISIQLLRNNNIKLSESTIWRVLSKNNMPKIKKYRQRNDFIHYNRPIPGDRVQVDVTKVKNQCYQFTVVDDCTRLRVLRLCPNKTAENAVLFLYEILEHFPFPILYC